MVAGIAAEPARSPGLLQDTASAWTAALSAPAWPGSVLVVSEVARALDEADEGEQV